MIPSTNLPGAMPFRVHPHPFPVRMYDTQTLGVYTPTCQRDSVAYVAEYSCSPSHALVCFEDTKANATGAGTRILARRS